MTDTAAPLARADALALPRALVPALLVAWTLAWGWPLLRLEGFDDAYFSEAAHLWTQGLPPYLGVFDVKPPGYFALLALAQSVFGPRIETLHGLSLACNVVTALALYGLGVRLGAARAGIAAAATFGALAAFVLANDAYPPLVAFTTLAFLAALSRGGAALRAAGAGLACGAAIMTKQTAVLETAALALYFARERSGRASVPIFLAAVAAIPLAFFAYFAAVGGLAALWRDVVAAALQRPAGVEAVDLAGDTARLIARLALLGPIVPLAALGAHRARALLRGDDARADALTLWAAVALAGLALQHARGLAYVGPVMPPTLLLAFVFAERGFGGNASAALRLAATALLALAAAFPLRAAAVRRPTDAAATARAAALIEAAAPLPGDRLLAVDFGGWLNIATDLAPPTPFIHRMHLLCRFPDAGPPRLAEAFAARPRFVVVGRYRGLPTACDAGPSGWPLAEAALAADYRQIGHVAGETDDLTLFARRP